MTFLILAIVGGVCCAFGVAFVIDGSMIWLTSHYGSIAAHYVIGSILLIIGLVLFSLFALQRSQSRRHAHAPMHTLGAALPELLSGLGAEDLRGLMLIFERRPVLAAMVALALGIGVGFKRGRT